jgi:RNA polymerase sigma factor (sigma-70 family)
MACLQPSLSNELGGRPPTSEKAGQRLMPDQQFPLTIKSLSQLWILIRCSMPGELTAATRAGVINWGDVAPNSGLRAPKAAKPRGRMEAQRAGSTWTPPMRASGSRDLASSDRAHMLDAEAQQHFRALMLPHLDAAYTLARYLTRDEDVAQDLVQDAFVRALRGFGNYRGENAKAWLLAIVRNLFLSSATARSSDRTVSLEAYVRPDCGEPDGSARELWDPDQDTPETALIRSSESRSVRDLIEALPVPFRETLVLRELEELSYQQIATATGSPVGTVMSRLARARQMLERAWRRRHGSNLEQRP